MREHFLNGFVFAAVGLDEMSWMDGGGQSTAESLLEQWAQLATPHLRQGSTVG
jgi:hypothetical protein